jgi:hypothetical protein
MKKFGLVIAVMFLLCALGTHPVSAQEPEYGYIPLLSEGYDISLPRQLLSHQAFERMVPLLMEAKAKGIIIDFKPDLYGGFVRVTGPSAALRGSLDNLPVKADMWDAIVRPPSSAETPATRSATLLISIDLYSSCFGIFNAGADQHIKGTMTTPSGELLGVIDAYADSGGQLWECFVGDGDAVPGNIVTFKRYVTGSGWLTSKTTVPRAAFKTITNSTGIVTGTGTAGLGYLVYWYHPRLDASQGYDYDSITGTISSTGKWSADFPITFLGQDWTYIRINKGVFYFTRGVDVPHLSCRLRTNYCTLYNLPDIPVSITVKHGGVPYSFSGKTDTWAMFSVSLINTMGDPVLLSAGDTITGTGATTYNLPNLTMSVNRSTNTVSGKAPASKYFSVSWYTIPSTESGWMWVGSTSSGAYTAAFSSDIPDAGFLETDIYYTQPGTGNTTSYWKYFE